MKTFKELRKEHSLEESIAVSLGLIGRDLLDIGWKLTKWTAKTGWKAGSAAAKGLEKRYNQQARLDRANLKLTQKGDKLERLRRAKQEFLDQKERIEKEKKKLLKVDAKTKEQNKKEYEELKKKLKFAEKEIDKNLTKIEKQL